MKTAPISKPFDLPITLRGGRSFGIFSLTIAIAAGLAGYLHFEGYFQLPAEYSTLPFDAFCAGIALIFFISGVPEFFKFRGYRVDPLKQTIQQITRGILGTRYGKEIPFSELNHILIVRENRGGYDNNKNFYFPVYICLKSNNPKQVFLTDRYLPARVCSEKLAKLTNVDLHDDSEIGAPTQIRKPEELDKTVREKLRKHFSNQSRPNIPRHMHAKIQLSFEALTIENPRFDISSLGPMKKALWIMFVIFGVWIAVALYFEDNIFTFFGAFFLGSMLYALLRSETLTLTRDTITAQTEVYFLKFTKRIPLSELEELFLTNVTKSESEESDKLLEGGYVTKSMHVALKTITAIGSAIVARSDHKSITFGRILSQEELDHILYQIKRWIRS